MFRSMLILFFVIAMVGCGRRSATVSGPRKVVTLDASCKLELSKSSIVLGESVTAKVLDESGTAVQATLQDGIVISPSGSLLSPRLSTTYTANTGRATCTAGLSVTIPAATPIPTATPIVTNPCAANPSLPSCKILPVSPTPDQNVVVILNYLCGVAQNRAYIEDSNVSNPIITFESNSVNALSTASRSLSSLSRLRFSGSRFLTKGPKSTGYRHELTLKFDKDPIRQWYATLKFPTTAWEMENVAIMVGDDENGNWSVGDDIRRSIRNKVNGTGGFPSFTAYNPPGRIVVDIFQGRGIDSKHKDFKKYCHAQSSPLVLDLHGDGIKLSNAQPRNVNYADVRFDIDGDGVKEYVGWVAGNDDALLALDRNRNGKIDSGRELFGNHTLLKDGTEADNGFEALKELDSDGDGFITRADRDWNLLRLWVDGYNHAEKGMSHPGELYSLEEMGVEKISLRYMQMAESDGYNTTRQRAVFEHRLHGKVFTKQVADIWFEVGAQ